MNLKNEISIYKSIIHSVWSYGIEIWGSAIPFNIMPLQIFQSISLRLITNAPWCVINTSLHKDLQLPPVTDLTKIYYKIFHDKVQTNLNPLIKNMTLLFFPSLPRCLKQN